MKTKKRNFYFWIIIVSKDLIARVFLTSSKGFTIKVIVMGSPEGLDEVFNAVKVDAYHCVKIKEKHVERNHILSRNKSSFSKYQYY